MKKDNHNNVKSRWSIIIVLIAATRLAAQDVDFTTIAGDEYVVLTQELATPDNQYQVAFKTYVTDRKKHNFFDVFVYEKDKPIPINKHDEEYFFNEKKLRKAHNINEGAYSDNITAEVATYSPTGKKDAKMFYIIINHEHGTHEYRYDLNNLRLTPDEAMSAIYYEGVHEELPWHYCQQEKDANY
ncbi:hypothetical protein JXA12_02240 [Candidatus Woesearchaeota archaeon]|nr:hypothetical protein [Candidatus Woesearchaeota archaeon]